MTVRLRPVLVAFIALIATGILAAAAIAAPPVTETTNVKNQTETFLDVIPNCENEDPYMITLTSNLVEHVTAFEDGREHGTFTQTGTFVAKALEPGGLDASGKVTIWGGFNDNGKTVNGTFTFNLTGSYSDGTKIDFHAVDHFNARPDGTENFFSRCHD
jgi:hypothetical protein